MSTAQCPCTFSIWTSEMPLCSIYSIVGILYIPTYAGCRYAFLKSIVRRYSMISKLVSEMICVDVVVSLFEKRLDKNCKAHFVEAKSAGVRICSYFCVRVFMYHSSFDCFRSTRFFKFLVPLVRKNCIAIIYGFNKNSITICLYTISSGVVFERVKCIQL